MVRAVPSAGAALSVVPQGAEACEIFVKKGFLLYFYTLVWKQNHKNKYL